MQIEMSFKNISANDSMKQFVQGKTEKLKKYFQGKMHVIWTLTAENDSIVSHAHVHGNQMEFFGEAVDSNYMTSVEGAIAKVESQIKKRKEKITNHHK